MRLRIFRLKFGIFVLSRPSSPERRIRKKRNMAVQMDQATARLGSERVGKLLLDYSIPAVIGMVMASLYNIVDRIFIGQGVGPLAISGLALTFPLKL